MEKAFHLNAISNIVKEFTLNQVLGIGVNYGGAEGRCPLRSNTEWGKICLTPSVFWLVIPTWQQEI